MKLTYLKHPDHAPRNGSKPDYLSAICFFTGLIAVIVAILYLGVVADALINLIELA